MRSQAAVDARRQHLSTTRSKAETAIIAAALALYVAFLLKLLLFSRALGSERSLNLVPFATIRRYLTGGAHGGGGIAIANLAGNVLVFVPLGAYLSWIRQRATAWTTWLFVVSVSVAVEVTQGVLGVGTSDIDDVILNGIGGLIGIVAWRLLVALLRERSRAQTAMAAWSALTIPVWTVLLLFIRLRL